MPLIGLSTLYLSLFNRPFKHVLRDMVRFTKGKGGPDIWEVVDIGSHSLTPDRIRSLKRFQSEGYHFTVHCPYDVAEEISHVKPVRRGRALRRMKASIDAAAALEAHGWVLHAGRAPESVDRRGSAWLLNQDAIVQLHDYAISAGVTAAIENMNPGPDNLMSRPEEFERLLEGTGIRVLMVFDPGHAHVGGYIEEFIARFASRIFIVHVHDNRGSYDDHLNIGEGTIKWSYIVAELAKRRFKGLYNVEAVREPLQSVAAMRELLFTCGRPKAGRGSPAASGPRQP